MKVRDRKRISPQHIQNRETGISTKPMLAMGGRCSGLPLLCFSESESQLQTASILGTRNYTAVRNPGPRPRYINLTCKILKPYPFTRTDLAQRESKQVIDKEGFERIGI